MLLLLLLIQPPEALAQLWRSTCGIPAEASPTAVGLLPACSPQTCEQLVSHHLPQARLQGP